MDFQSSPLPHDIYLDPPPPPPPQWSQQQEGGGVDNINHVQVDGHEHGSMDRPAGSMVVRARLAKLPPPEVALKCPRCESINTKFCYFNNYSLSQPRHFCKTCRRYWTRGGALRNVPVGGGCRRNNKKCNKRKRGSKSPTLTISKPVSISAPNPRGIFENFLTQTHPLNLQPNLPDHPLSDQYNLLGMGSGAVGFILGNRFHNIEQWRGEETHELGHHIHQFPYMGAGLDIPNQLASSTTNTTTPPYNHPSDHYPLMKVELGNLGLNLLGNNNENVGNDHHDLDQYWEGGNHNIMSSNNINNIASSAWSTDHHRVSRFGTSSSTHLM